MKPNCSEKQKQNRSGGAAFVSALLLPLVAFILTAPPARAQLVEMQSVTLNVPVRSYEPTAVNILKQVVGNFVTNSGATQGFVYYGPGFTTRTLDAPGSNKFTRAGGINLYGTIVGDFFGTDGVYHGYFYNGGYTTYDLPGFNEDKNKFSTSLFGISDLGNLAGAANPHGHVEGFVVIGGGLSTFYAVDKDDTYALAVNDAGTAAGEYVDSKGGIHGFMWSPADGITLIDYQGAAVTVCSGIDNIGNVFGTYIDAKGFPHGFTRDPLGNLYTNDLPVAGVSSDSKYYVGTYNAPGGAVMGYVGTPEGTPGLDPVTVTDAQSTSLYGVNGENKVGKYTDSGGVNHGVLVTSPVGSEFTTIDDPVAANHSTVCQGINASGKIVCNYTDNKGNPQAAVYFNGVFTPVKYPGAVSLNAYGIDDAGDLVGFFNDSSNNTHGFLLKGGIGGTPVKLDAPGANFTVATGLNNNGKVTVFWGDATGYVESSTYDTTSQAYTKANLLGAANSYAGGIDDAGDIIYTWTDVENNIHGGLFSAHEQGYYLLDVGATLPNGSGTRAYGIFSHPNGVRDIVGYYPLAGSTTNFNGFRLKL